MQFEPGCERRLNRPRPSLHCRAAEHEDPKFIFGFLRWKRLGLKMRLPRFGNLVAARFLVHHEQWMKIAEADERIVEIGRFAEPQASQHHLARDEGCKSENDRGQ